MLNESEYIITSTYDMENNVLQPLLIKNNGFRNMKPLIEEKDVLQVETADNDYNGELICFLYDNLFYIGYYNTINEEIIITFLDSGLLHIEEPHLFKAFGIVRKVIKEIPLFEEM